MLFLSFHIIFFCSYKSDVGICHIDLSLYTPYLSFRFIQSIMPVEPWHGSVSELGRPSYGLSKSAAQRKSKAELAACARSPVSAKQVKS